MSEKPLNFEQLIDSITPEAYQKLKTAIELGKWPDGRKLSDEQKESTMQAIIAYEHRHLPEQQHVGFIDRGSKEEGETCGGHDHDDVQSVQIKTIQ